MPTKGEKAFFAQTEVIGNGKGNQANLIMSLLCPSGFPEQFGCHWSGHLYRIRRYRKLKVRSMPAHSLLSCSN